MQDDILAYQFKLITFRVSLIRGEMYSGRGRLSVPRRILTLLYGPGCNLEEWQGCPVIAHY